MTEQYSPAGPIETIATTNAVANVPILAADATTVTGSIVHPGTIAAGKSWTSEVVPTGGMRHLGAAATMDSEGTLSVQPYMDAAGTIAAGSAVTQAMTSGKLATIDSVGTVITQAVTVGIANSGKGTATVSALTVVLAAQ